MVEAAEESEALFDRLTSWENLYRAARRARLGKRRQEEVARFELDREYELLRVQDELRRRSYRPGVYRAFWIREPKRRLISAAPYRDRVVHHALIQVIGPLFERNFLRDSYANQVGKGTHRAVARYHQFAQRYRYVLPCDIVKFFPSIDHEILKGLIRSRVRDPDVLWLCDAVIDASNPQEPVREYYPGDDLFTPDRRPRGLPIGNLTSQFWANVYLHGLDSFVKRGLRCPGYVRYVDDFLIFGDDKQALREAREAVIRFLYRLRLRIHENRAQVRPTDRPTRFLGYRCWPDHRFLTRENIRRFRRYGRVLQRLYAVGEMGLRDVKARLASWNAHAATANGYRLRCRVFAALRFTRGPVETAVSCAAAPGTTIRGTAARRIATGTGRTTATTTSACGLWCRWRLGGVSSSFGPECRPSRRPAVRPESPNRAPVLLRGRALCRSGLRPRLRGVRGGGDECVLWPRPAHAVIAPGGARTHEEDRDAIDSKA